MEVHIKIIPDWVTKTFGVEAQDTCKVIRVDERDALNEKKTLYLIKTKTGKNVTVYSHEITEIKAN